MTATEAQKMTGAQCLIKALEDVGVDTIFGYPGGQAIDIYNALYDSKKLHHILVRHEQGAAHAADGYARATGKVGTVIVTSGSSIFSIWISKILTGRAFRSTVFPSRASS